MRHRHVLRLVAVPLSALLLTLGAAPAASAADGATIGVGLGAGLTSAVGAVLRLGVG